MAAEGTAGRDEVRATKLATGTGRTLAASMPRLILEARKIAATVIQRMAAMDGLAGDDTRMLEAIAYRRGAGVTFGLIARSEATKQSRGRAEPLDSVRGLLRCARNDG
mgnify:CR=1 FL=1